MKILEELVVLGILALIYGESRGPEGHCRRRGPDPDYRRKKESIPIRPSPAD